MAAAAARRSCDFQMRIAFMNVSNTLVNEHGVRYHWEGPEEPLCCSPLHARLSAIISEICKLAEQPDVLFLLGVGRESGGHSWTEMALYVEKSTGLSYHGVSYVSPTTDSLGTAMFFNKTRALCTTTCRRYYSETSDTPSGSATGLLLFTLFQVCDGTVVADKPLHCVVFNVARLREDPLELARWLVTHSYLGALYMGTWSTDSQYDFLQTSEEMSKGGIFRELEVAEPTFKAYPHDLTYFPVGRPLGIFDDIVYSDRDGLWARRVGFFERCFAKKNLNVQFATKHVARASDHALCTLKVSFVSKSQ